MSYWTVRRKAKAAAAQKISQLEHDTDDSDSHDRDAGHTVGVCPKRPPTQNGRLLKMNENVKVVYWVLCDKQ